MVLTLKQPPAQIEVKAGQPYAVNMCVLVPTAPIGDYSSQLIVTDPTTTYTIPMHAKVDSDTHGTKLSFLTARVRGSRRGVRRPSRWR